MGPEPSLAEPSFPKLEVAKDPELMREVFQRHLRPLDGRTYRVWECRISDIYYRSELHFRRAPRWVLRYTLRLAEPETGRERSQWVSGVMYAGDRTRRKWERLQRSEPGRGTPDASPAFAPFSYIPDLDMLVQVFPYDNRLPALPLLMAGLPPELEPLLLTRFGPGDWRAEAWDVKAVRYRPAEVATLRLAARARDASTGRAEERRFYAKIYRREEEGERTYQVLRALWDRAGSGGAGFSVARPIAYLSGLRTLLQEEVPGASLKDLLLREEDEAIPAVRKAAKALASLHLDEDVVAPRRISLRDEVAALEKVRRVLQQACPHLRPEIEEAVGAVVTGLEEVPCAPIHSDLKPEHIMVDGDSIGLIDLDEFAEADPVRDVGQVLAFLINMPLVWSGRFPLPHDRAWAAARAFTEEYFAHVPEAWHTRLPLRYADMVLTRAATIFLHQVPGWSDNIEALVEGAKESLAGRVW